MSTNTAQIVRQPALFVYGENFEVFFRQFRTYATNVKCDTAAQFSLLLSYLDTKSYAEVEKIVFSADEITAYKADLNAALPKLRVALKKPTDMPARVALKFRRQGANESIANFSEAIETLGREAFGNSENNEHVISAFCTGVKDPDLCATLLTTDFTTLSAAVALARDRESKRHVKELLRKTRDRESEVSSAVEVSVLAVAANEEEKGRSYKGNYTNTDHHGARGTPPDDDRRYGNTNYSRGGPDSYNASRGQHEGYRSRDSRNVKCYICSKFGHYATACRQRDNSRTCHYCGVAGHLIKTCFKRQNDERRGGPSYTQGEGSQNFRRGPGNQAQKWSN